ncbi:MAG: FKBP-type peptidyl-prolyl cis-trans isomerase [Muribaculaceae bacterium]|nr:FKBP-type peptidyl-prolyl cis-trans isomerase [Muribaculaceae bacterium]
MEKIQAGKFVQLAYEIFVADEQGDASMFKFTREHPDAFVFGLDPGMLPAFMKNIEGLATADKFDFTLEPDEAFGPRDPEAVWDIPRDTFFVDGEFDSERVFVGATLPMQTHDGYRMNGTVERIDDNVVVMDFNHPLAGARVHYVGEVLAVRDATPEELNPAPHGCGCGCGHDHDHGGDCGCGDCGCGDCGGCK